MGSLEDTCTGEFDPMDTSSSMLDPMARLAGLIPGTMVTTLDDFSLTILR